MLGYSREELLALPVSAVHPDDVAKFRTFARSVLEQGSGWTNELSCVTKAGSRLPVEISASMIQLGGRTCVISAVRDITDRKQTEAALRDSEERYRVISELTSDFAYSVRIEQDERFSIEWITDAFTRTTGFSLEELKDNGWKAVIHPQDFALFEQWGKALVRGQTSVAEFRLVTKDGNIRWVRHYGQPVWNAYHSHVERIHGAGRDMTERKRLEEMLQEGIIKPPEVPANLRKFREHLSLSQRAFGERFGGHSLRQISSYENGGADVPISLLLAIKNNGYSLDVVLGARRKDAIDDVLSSLSSSQKAHVVALQLVDIAKKLLTQENETLNNLVECLGLPQRSTSKESEMLTEVLQRMNDSAKVVVSRGPRPRSKKPNIPAA